MLGIIGPVAVGARAGAALLMVGVCMMANAADPANYDESKIPPYTLPDPFVTSKGEKVSTLDDWHQKRRLDLLLLFSEHVYGGTHPKPAEMSYRVLQESSNALDGKAIRKVIRIQFGKSADAPYLGVHLYLPANAPGPVPVFVGVNLFDKASALPKPGGRMAKDRVKIPDSIDPKMLPGDETIFRILERGYGIATFHPGDIAPDDAKTFTKGIIGQMNGQLPQRQPSEWGALGAWAFGICRVVDVLSEDEKVDAKRLIAIGHSRNGKAALWAGFQDARIAAVISNQSGCGGAALSKRKFGETVALINERFPHWFCERFREYNDKEQNLPVDQHLLIAGIAPRPVHIGSAEDDRWADPRGEFLSAVAADPVFEFLGAKGLGTKEFPPINQVVGDRLSYHCRWGEHALADYDWMVYLDWCDRVLRP